VIVRCKYQTAARNQERLAQELAQLTGESLTTAVTLALRERLERTRVQCSAHWLSASCASARIARRGLKSPTGP
jgi:hypothetical protein